ncbi:hypothetical protein [Conexibacter sp. SYSU D00693]|uniref:hypothetical protein n=1 Tax=Conexibacter sp. SYSU D00693 TaxID=2812560 RepID=UPI00196BA0F2|nr:hypothetical protein [Conexibacter sp. SYSU D00693]
MSPLARIPLDIAKFALRTGVSLGRTAFDQLADRLPVGGHGDGGAQQANGTATATPPASEAVRDAPPTPAPAPRPRRAQEVSQKRNPPAGTPIGRPDTAPATPDLEATPEFAPRHVDTGVTEVASFGPEDDAGPSITVDAPWPDYDGMSASAVVARVRDADDATKAAVLLYERQGKGRKTVITAAGG